MKPTKSKPLMSVEWPILLIDLCMLCQPLLSIPDLLFGRSPAGINATGESETRNFYDAVKTEQEGKLRGVS